jgi:hypothetical protein
MADRPALDEANQQAKGYLNRQNRRQNRLGEMNGMAERHKKASPHGLWCRPINTLPQAR